MAFYLTSGSRESSCKLRSWIGNRRVGELFRQTSVRSNPNRRVTKSAPTAAMTPDGLWRGTYKCEIGIVSAQQVGQGGGTGFEMAAAFTFNLDVRLANGIGSTQHS